jgi:phosphoribosylanthranilate isomerase
VTKIKICGVRQVEHAVVAAESGADFVGLVFAPSARRIDPETGEQLSDAVKRAGEAKVVGVFVNESVETMNALVRRCAIDYVQLSGDEPDEVVEQIDASVIRTVHVTETLDRAALQNRVASITAELVLLDSARSGLYGGTGHVFEWSRLPATHRPIMVAGGLHSENVLEAIEAMDPWGVDVSGGVETNGVKDEQKIRDFIRTVKHL